MGKLFGLFHIKHFLSFFTAKKKNNDLFLSEGLFVSGAHPRLFLFNSEATHSPPETSESAASRISTHFMPEGVPNLFAQANHTSPSPSGSSNISNGLSLASGNRQPYALPKPNGKEVLNLL